MARPAVPGLMRGARPPLVPPPDTAAIRARGETLAVALRAAMTQDELRLMSAATYSTICRGTMHPREVAVLRPVLTALALAIDEPDMREGEDLRPGRFPGLRERRLRDLVRGRTRTGRPR